MENEELKQKVETALDEIRPYLLNDGGNISLVSIDSDKVVKVRLEGNCVGCRINQMTMKLGVEETIKKHVPEIKEVLNVA
ncbi:MAG: NifU family protein [Bacteroidetes bacterium]|nr:NifU family protein [Bacteroidota bacterium]